MKYEKDVFPAPTFVEEICRYLLLWFSLLWLIGYGLFGVINGFIRKKQD